MRLHPRYFPVAEATNGLILTFLRIEEHLNPTMDEVIEPLLVIASATIKADSLSKRKTPDGLSEIGKEFLKELILTEEKYGLTQGESMKILLEHAASMTKYVIRHERHPKNSDKKGDEA